MANITTDIQGGPSGSLKLSLPARSQRHVPRNTVDEHRSFIVLSLHHYPSHLLSGAWLPGVPPGQESGKEGNPPSASWLGGLAVSLWNFPGPQASRSFQIWDPGKDGAPVRPRQDAGRRRDGRGPESPGMLPGPAPPCLTADLREPWERGEPKQPPCQWLCLFIAARGWGGLFPHLTPTQMAPRHDAVGAPESPHKLCDWGRWPRLRVLVGRTPGWDGNPPPRLVPRIR